MRVLIVTQGSRGDVQPFVALARGLACAGHEVTIGAPAAFASLLEPYEVQFVAFEDVMMRQIGRSDIRKAIESDCHGFRAKILRLQYMLDIRKLMVRMVREVVAAAEGGTDLIVHHFELPGHELAERLGVPSVPVCLHPSYVPTSLFPNLRFPFRLPPSLNRASYLWTNLVMYIQGANTSKWRRKTLELPRRRGHRNVLSRPDRTPATVLQAFSRHILPSPLDYPNSVHTTGFWFLPSEVGWSPPRHIYDFLKAGDEPVYIGFGSIAGPDPRRTGKIILDAIRLAKVRAVVASGWGGIELGGHEKDVLYIEGAPHDWLFPRMAAIVHHGGAGTTAAALASGRPQVVCPFTGDQPFNAVRVHKSGVAPSPQPQRTLSAEGLAEAIHHAVTDSRLADRAAKLGEEVRSEDGVTTAVKLVESIVSK